MDVYTRASWCWQCFKAAVETRSDGVAVMVQGKKVERRHPQKPAIELIELIARTMLSGKCSGFGLQAQL